MVADFLRSQIFNRIITPLFCAAIAAVVGYYFLFYSHYAFTTVVLFLLLLTHCFFYVLSVTNLKIVIIQNIQAGSLEKISLCVTAFAVGVVLGICAAGAGKNNVSFGLLEEKVTAVEGLLLEDPRVLPSGTAMAAISLKRSRGENVRVSSYGEITLFFPQEMAQKLREFGRNTVIFAEGNLRSTDKGWTFSAASLHIVKTAPPIQRMRTNIRLNLIDRFDGKSWGGLALALLVGIKDNLDVNLTTLYRDAGLSYILALSGMHLAVITALISFLLKRPLGLKAASITGAVIICLYCFIVGPMPSLVRSAVMYLLGVLTILAGLPKKSMSVLCLSFLIQILITPAAGNSLSFILSYLALLGIIITSRQITSLLGGTIPNFLLQPLAMSCGAFLATAGVCSFSFGTIAPIGIIAGLFIVPLTTIFMIGSIIWLLLDFISISFIIGYPLSWIYRLMEIVSSVAGNVPGIKANPVLILVISVLLLILIAVLEYKQKKNLLNLRPFL